MLPLLALVATATPAIDVYTFGPGDDIFSHFGHSAICVQEGTDDRCYNFGTADFDTPLPLTRDFIRGRASFWVSVVQREPMLAYYRQSDRTTWRQRLPLDGNEARALAHDLRTVSSGASRYYLYHHYFDNCTTRIRDAVDRATDGRLKARGGGSGPTFRDYTRRGFAEQPALLLLTALILGRGADRPTTTWETMFLPAELMAALEVPAVEAYTRRGPLPPREAPPIEWAFAGLGAVLAGALWVAERRGRRAGRAVVGLILGLLALLPWALALASAFPELRYNEVLLVLWPTDLALPFLGAPAARRYAVVRSTGLALVTAALLMGLALQPLGPLILLAALPLLVLARAR